MPYNATGVSTFEGLFMRSNEFMGGGLGLGILFVVWGISFYTLNDFPVRDSVSASTYITFLTSSILTLIEVVEPAFTFLLLIASLAIASYNYANNQR
ncbi:hypothetical protein SAMN05443574_14010 [Haloarcula vallismortis]|uniref:Uncharacterized protein n=3 Tax=Haloarcula vallismortis TaxID=28442 RepID=M0JDR3_HALVA|nr:hypothetical protein C437_12226 [Haloarcula vallismortis ATCC 29715]SDX38239.1 hypothetical protein SAMN05443574_14010 [Haloarcula vallismortis]